jgi:hypothetical protein
VQPVCSSPDKNSQRNMGAHAPLAPRSPSQSSLGISEKDPHSAALKFNIIMRVEALPETTTLSKLFFGGYPSPKRFPDS